MDLSNPNYIENGRKSSTYALYDYERMLKFRMRSAVSAQLNLLMKMNKQTATLTTRGVRAKRRKISLWKKFQSKFNAEEWKDLCVQELEEGRKTSCSTRKIEKATLLLRNNSSRLSSLSVWVDEATHESGVNPYVYIAVTRSRN